MKSQIKRFLVERCIEHGIELEFHCITGNCSQFSRLFREYPNVIAWNCRSSHEWLSGAGQNVLVADNSLLAQGSGIFIDNGGFYSKSNLCRERTWQNVHEVDLAAHTRRHFKWEPLQGGDPNGPILVCLQNKDDAHMRYEFPLGDGAEDRVGRSLELLYDHLPDVETIVRPHPRFKEKWEEHRQAYKLRRDWRVDWEGKFWEVLPKCRALVTVNSTCASEAATLGLPIATLGTGEFNGSGISLECARHPERLRDILTWEPATNAGKRWGEAVLGRHHLSYRNPVDCLEFDLWLSRAGEGKVLSCSSRRVKSAPSQSRIRMSDPLNELKEATDKLEATTRENKELLAKLEALNPPELAENDHSILKVVLATEDGVLYTKLAEATSLSAMRVQHHVDQLERRGFVATHGGGDRQPHRILGTKTGVDYAVRQNLI